MIKDIFITNYSKQLSMNIEESDIFIDSYWTKFYDVEK